MIESQKFSKHLIIFMNNITLTNLFIAMPGVSILSTNTDTHVEIWVTIVKQDATISNLKIIHLEK